jgi:serine/threonine-protein kinase
VTVLVSSGPAQVRVPDLTGDSRNGAEAALSAVGLAVGTVSEQVSAGASAGAVLSQSPQAGSSVGTGSKVNLTVAKASNEVVVPKLLGQTVTQASAALGGAGFTPSVVQVPVSEPSKVNVVLKQSPTAGKTARKGSTVTLTVGVLETTPTTPTTPTTTTPTTTTTTTPTPPAAGAG